MKVEISPYGNGGYHVCLDGVDISSVVVENGARIWWEQGQPMVELTLRPAELYAELDPAVIRVCDELRRRDPLTAPLGGVEVRDHIVG